MDKIKKAKKKIIIIAVIIVLILVFILANVFGKKEEEEPKFETAKVETKTLTTTISSTGKISTETTKNVTSQLVNYKITGVNVKVGDKVNVGDVLCTFDTADLAKTVNDLRASINAGNVAGNASVSMGEGQIQAAQTQKDMTLQPLEKQLKETRNQHDTQRTNLENARKDLTNVQQQLAQLQSQETELSKAKDVAQAEQSVALNVLNQKQAEVAQAQAAVDAATVGGLTPDSTLTTTLTNAIQARDNAQADLTAKESALTNAINNLSNVKNQVANLNSSVSGLNQQIAALDSTVKQLKDAYNQAADTYNQTAKLQDIAISSAQSQVDSARAQASVSSVSTEQQLTTLQKQLEDTNLKSTVSGTVTAVTAKAGDYYTGGVLLTIEGAESFIVETEIDEYDIADIAVGMQAEIKTDATRDEILSGEVISVAPSATGSTASAMSASAGMSGMTGMTGATSASATYTVKVAINTPNDRLRLGMNSKINIITQKSENALAVPYDAITEKEDGTKVVTVIKDDGSEEEVKVTTGLESGYYTEVSSDKLKEGTKIKLPEIESSSTVDELLNSMGATAGM